MKRDVLIIAAICILAIAIGAWAFLKSEGTQAVPTEAKEEVSVRVLAEGTNAATTLKKNYRVLNEEQLEQVWALAYGQTVDALPAVDFSREEVLAVFGGERPTGGYSVAVERVTDGATREVVIAHAAPGSSCIVTDALTSPFQIVVVSKTDKEMNRTDRTVTVACE